MGEVYNQIKLLGEGAFGKAYLVEAGSDRQQCVIKQMDISSMSDQERKDALREAKILEAFDHPNIIRFREVYKTRKGKLCIVMDYADGGDLTAAIKGQRGRFFPEEKIVDWFVQMCLALKHVHDRKVLHRDIKAQNVFLTRGGMIKLGDFGIARVLSNTKENAKTCIGTPYYLSPEIVENRPYSFKSDVWSLGVLLYEMCALKPPFDGSSLHFLAMKIVRGNYPPPPSHYSSNLKQLISQMLQVDPLKRPSIAQILKHPLLTNRIRSFLSESVRLNEFSHTVLHKQNVFEVAQKAQEDSRRDQEEVKRREQKASEDARREQEEKFRREVNDARRREEESRRHQEEAKRREAQEARRREEREHVKKREAAQAKLQEEAADRKRKIEENKRELEKEKARRDNFVMPRGPVEYKPPSIRAESPRAGPSEYKPLPLRSESPRVLPQPPPSAIARQIEVEKDRIRGRVEPPTPPARQESPNSAKALEKIDQRNEERKSMLNDIRKRKYQIAQQKREKAPKPAEELKVARLSIEEADEQGLIYAMQEAMLENEDEHEEIEIQVECDSDEERDDPEFGASSTNPLNSLRLFLTEKIGAEVLGQVTQVIRNIDERDLVANGYEKYYNRVEHIMTKDLQNEYFPLIHTLTYIESKI